LAGYEAADTDDPSMAEEATIGAAEWKAIEETAAVWGKRNRD
jgi:hypothetical protein